MGYQSLRRNVSGSSNTAIGYDALRENLGSNNTALGVGALSIGTGSSNLVAI